MNKSSKSIVVCLIVVGILSTASCGKKEIASESSDVNSSNTDVADKNVGDCKSDLEKFGSIFKEISETDGELPEKADVAKSKLSEVLGVDFSEMKDPWGSKYVLDSTYGMNGELRIISAGKDKSFVETGDNIILTVVKNKDNEFRSEVKEMQPVNDIDVVSDTYEGAAEMTEEEAKAIGFEIVDDGDKVGTIAKYTGTAKNLIIPAKVGDIDVKFISKEAFKNCELKNVKISDGIKSIGYNAFKSRAYDTDGLRTVEIPESVETLDFGVFSGNQIRSITLPDNIEKVCDTLLSENRLTEVKMGNKVKTIGISAFSSNLLSTIEIPESVTEIQRYAFSDNLLSSVNIPSGISEISDYAYAKNKLASVIIPENVKSIGAKAFYRNELTSVSMNEGLGKIGGEAFGANKLTSITIPSTVGDFGEKIFIDNAGLSDIGYKGSANVPDWGVSEQADFNKSSGNESKDANIKDN